MTRTSIDALLTWRGLTALLTIGGIVVGVAFAWATLSGRVGAIERDHILFAEQYQRQINDIKSSLLRLEDKFDRLIVR
ncbi:MAG: hypothetical protein AABY15_07625 [Nanoarchaeota archaeon]